MRRRHHLPHLLHLAPALALLLSSGSSVANPPVPLEDRTWTVVRLNGQDLPDDAPLAQTPIVSLSAGRLGGSGGCNRIGGAYTQSGDQLRIGPVMSTRRACAAGMDHEDALLRALPEVAAWRGSSAGGVDAVEWLDAAGQVLVRLERRVWMFRCSSGQTLRVRYSPGAAQLLLDGREYRLQAQPGASGVQYATAQGRRPDVSLHWATQGAEGQLSEAPLDERTRPQDRQLIATCQRA